MVNDVISGVVGDVLHQKCPGPILPGQRGQLHPEVCHILVGVDIPAQAQARVIPGEITSFGVAVTDFN